MSCDSLLAFSFSRSIALSLAALGAAGKNWAKLALEGRVIVFFVSACAGSSGGGSNNANWRHLYHSLRPPTIVRRKRNERGDTIHVRVDEIESDGRGRRRGGARRDTRQVRKGWVGVADGGDEWEIALICKPRPQVEVGNDVRGRADDGRTSVR